MKIHRYSVALTMMICILILCAGNLTGCGLRSPGKNESGSSQNQSAGHPAAQADAPVQDSAAQAEPDKQNSAAQAEPDEQNSAAREEPAQQAQEEWFDDIDAEESFDFGLE